MNIETTFERIGARARTRLAEPARTWDWRRRRWEAGTVQAVAIDVRRDRRGEYFDISVREDIELEVLDVDRRDRHLLLLARIDAEKARYLCGHDERHWFVAAIPERTPVSTVEDAKLALHPPIGLSNVSSPRKQLVARRSVAMVRQGEWFFIPAPDFQPGASEAIRRAEPITRGAGSTPHVAAEAIRSGGRVLWFPIIRQRIAARGYSEPAMRRLATSHPKWDWRSFLVDPVLHVRGTVRHPDHKTITLRGWHRVVMNTESTAAAAPHVVFLD